MIYSLAALTPGMMPARSSLGVTQSAGAGSNFNVRGNRRVDNVVLLDGGILSFGNGQLTFLISPDAVQEFEVKTGLYGAEYGLRPGGTFTVVTKSGTNALHGTPVRVPPQRQPGCAQLLRSWPPSRVQAQPVWRRRRGADL